MKNINDKNPKMFYNAIVTVMLLLVMGACSKWDDYKDFSKSGEIVYTGKMDSVKVFSGRFRVRIKGLLPADPSITKCVISWNGGKDSVVFPIDKGGEEVFFDQTFKVAEGVQNFEIRTFDSEGNSSVPVYETGTVYGSRYEKGLNNRPLIKNQLFAGNSTVTVDFGAMNLSTGVFATEIKYTDMNNHLDSVRVPIDSEEVKIANYKVGSSFQYRTLFLPDSNAIDTFYAPYKSAVPEITYLKNLGDPFEHAEWDGSRWGVLADWISNDNVKNAGGDQYGGYELRGGAGVLSFEAGWGIRAVPNGKIYQITTLPAGKYEFIPTISERGDLGEIYTAVCEGTSFPDFNNVESESIAYALQGKEGKKLQFELTKTTTVAIGFVADMPDNGSFFKVSKVEFNRVE